MIMIMMIIIIVPLIGNTETHNLRSAAVFFVKCVFDAVLKA